MKNTEQKHTLQKVGFNGFHETMTASVETMLSCLDMEVTKALHRFTFKNSTAEDTFSYCLESFAKAVTASVFKSAHARPEAYNEALEKVRAEFLAVMAKEESKRIASIIAYGYRYNEDGKKERIIVDSHARQVLKENAEMNYEDGFDVFHTAILSISENLLEMICSDSLIDFESTTEKTMLKKRIFKAGVEITADDYKTVENKRIVNVFKDTRKAITDNKHVKALLGNTVYYEDFEQAEQGEMIYRYFGKYADIGGYVAEPKADGGKKKTAGNAGLYTADYESAESLYAMVEELRLTARQKTVLQYRLQGLSNVQISERMKIRRQVVDRHLKAIQSKVKKEVLQAEQERQAKTEKAESSECYKLAEEIAYMVMHGRQ